MALSSVKFCLYDNTGLNLLYTFTYVNYTNAPQSNKKHTIVEGIRGIGSVIVEGSEGSWDLILDGVLVANDYEALIVLIDALESAVVVNTQYYLKIDKTDSTTYSYKVKRLIPIEYPKSLRNYQQKYRIIFRVNSW